MFTGPHYFLTRSIREDFKELPDLGNYHGLRPRPDFDSDLGEMTNQEKTETFLTGH